MPKKNKTKIAITTAGPHLESQVDPRFGRCEYFLIINQDGELIESIANRGQQARRGAGIAAAQELGEKGIDTIITGNIGPNAFGVINSIGLKVYLADPGLSAREAFSKWDQQELKLVKKPSSLGRFGRGLGRGRGPGRGAGF